MSPAQEVANALTMLLPLAYALDALRAVPTPSGAHVVAASIAVHFPFSFVYHLWCAANPRAHPVVGNVFCKLDLVFIHVAGAFMAYGTSGSPSWLAANLAFNLTCAYRTWRWWSTTLERRLCRLLCAAGYMAPIAAVDAALLAQVCLMFTLMALPFALNKALGGWGHALSHVVLGPFALAVITAGAVVPVGPVGGAVAVTVLQGAVRTAEALQPAWA